LWTQHFEKAASAKGRRFLIERPMEYCFDFSEGSDSSYLREEVKVEVAFGEIVGQSAAMKRILHHINFHSRCILSFRLLG